MQRSSAAFRCSAEVFNTRGARNGPEGLTRHVARGLQRVGA